ncbi:hypothetical protein [Paenibacillus sp. MMS18-CY102]|uniref:hypothetical protein n=1 Tax=Paenibacillus sp. MMS18-CY102 TaxID=2682849 RepID=UPI0013661265|nr:hypothetical protein [Paenibacillus sp. MMS18-CY102]MWC30236.1 hypothetical protein [Paenibacillus sp. MMS18-CY102]
MSKQYLILFALLLIAIGLVGCGNDTTSPSNEASNDEASSHDQHTAQPDTTAPASSSSNKATNYSLDASSYQENGVHYLKVTTNLKLSSEHYEGAPVDGEGHIHFYLNGDLIGPIKDDAPYPLQNLKAGANTIKLVLAENNHSESYGVTKELSVENK